MAHKRPKVRDYGARICEVRTTHDRYFIITLVNRDGVESEPIHVPHTDLSYPRKFGWAFPARLVDLR